MHEEALTDDDSQLIDALQVWPRAPWAKLAPVLDADPVTLARRWARLSDRGLAWVTVQQPGTASATGGLLEVECRSGSLAAVIDELVQDSECLSVDVTSGARHLLLTVNCADATAFSQYVVDRVSAVEGVRTVRANPVVRIIAVATQWRLRALDGPQTHAIEAARDDAAGRRQVRRAAVDPEVARLLTLDGRATTQSVAETLGIPVRRARERLAETLAAPDLRLRTDTPRWATGWPVAAWYFVRVPAAHLTEVRTKLRSLRQVRAVLSVAGPANVMINVWLRELSDVEHLEEVMEQQLPAVSVLDRSLVLSVRKRMGRVFDADERPLQVVPWEG